MISFVSIILDTSKTKSSVLMSPESGFFLDDGTILFICYSSGVWRIFIEQEGSAPHKHKVCQETSEDDYSDEFYTEADVVRHEIASARN